MKRVLLSLWLWGLAGLCLADTPRPDVEQIFPLRAEVLDAQTVRLTWRIADGYFMFRSKFRIESETQGIALGTLAFPQSVAQDDAFFGPQEVYRGQLTVDVPLRRSPGAPDILRLQAASQGCASMEDCYPPHLQRVSLDLPPFDAALAKPADDARAKPDAAAGAEGEFLDPEMAFQFSVMRNAPDSLLAKWEIADGYYLYRDKLRFAAQNAPQALGDPQIPAGDIKDDPLFGQVEVFHKRLEVVLPLKAAEGLEHLVLNVGYQGCAEAGLCYPPIEKSPTLALASPEQPDGAAKSRKPDLSALLGGAKSAPARTESGDFLDPEQAFQFSALAQDADTLAAHWQIADGYYLYRDKFKFRLEGGELGEVVLPEGSLKDDPEYGKVAVLYQAVTAMLSLRQAAGKSVVLHVEYQGCAEAGLCYPPTKKSVTLDLATGQATAASAVPETAGALSEQDSIARSLAQGSVPWVILSFFGFGLLLSLTPCVFPMIPILSSIIVGQGRTLTTHRAFVMSLVYVLAMALTYTVAGVFAGMVGENLQAAFQDPWVLGIFAAVFVLLSLSMFGFYELQMPSALQSRLTAVSSRQQGGTLLGVAIMGFLSALIVGPCVAAPLAGALIYISQSQDAVLGGVALFALSMGMGVPLLIIGTSAGQLLPRAGGWMEIVKYVFGVLLLAVAVWMLERIVPAQVAMLLWAALLIVPAVYMGALDSLPAGVSGWRKFWKGAGVMLLLYGVLLVVGAAGGGGDVFQPLRGVALGGGGGVSQAAPQHGLAFKRIKSIADLQAEVAAAQAQGKPVMLDFYADWCISCKEMERFTFSDARVRQALAGTVLLQADVTANDAQDKALLKQFGLYGPPSILFFGADGVERQAYRIVGFKAADAFLAHVQQAVGPQ